MEIFQVVFLFVLLHQHLIHLALANDDDKAANSKRYRIAVIGGGISGSFVTKYISEYDVAHATTTVNGKQREKCLVDEIDVFDVSPPPVFRIMTNQSTVAATTTKMIFYNPLRIHGPKIGKVAEFLLLSSKTQLSSWEHLSYLMGTN